MNTKEKKIIDLLKFYRKEGQPIQLVYNGKVKVEGTIRKLIWLIFKPHLILDTEAGAMKIFIEDIADNSVVPSDLEVQTNFHRKSIPKSIRNELWRNHFGERFRGNCFVCKSQIQKNNFEAGHVVAVANGGTETLDNLRPICRTCNRSMGTQNLEDFKKSFH